MNNYRMLHCARNIVWILALKLMTTAHNEPVQRVAIWSLSPQTIGAYFAVFLVQYILGIAFETFAYIQSAASADFMYVALEIVKASGPIGIGSAMSAIAIAVLVESVMVLAKMLERQKREEGFRQGIEQGVKQERKRSNAKLRAWAKENGISEDKLPLAPEDDN